MFTGYNPAGNYPLQGAKEKYTSSNGEHPTNTGKGSSGIMKTGEFINTNKATWHIRKSVVEVK